MDENRLGPAIRARRLELSLTQEHLAERMAELGDDNIRQSDISRIENGQVQVPRIDRLQRLAGALEFTIEELLTAAGWIGGEAPQRQRTREETAPEPAAHRSAPLSPGSLDDSRGARVQEPAAGYGAVLRDALDAVHVDRARFEQSRTSFEHIQRLYEEARRKFESSPRGEEQAR